VQTFETTMGHQPDKRQRLSRQVCHVAGHGLASPVQKLEASFMSIHKPSQGAMSWKAASWRRHQSWAPECRKSG